MKRIIALLLIVLMTFGIFASTSTAALSSPIGESYHSIETQIKGTGGISTKNWKNEIDIGKTITVKAIETNSPFLFWEVIGDYEIINGEATDKEFTIQPLSDIIIIATFEDGVNETAITGNIESTQSIENINNSSTSPKTGQGNFSVYIVLMIAIVVIVGIFYGKKKLKYRREYNKI